MPEVVEDLKDLPLGSHALSLHATRTEGADHAIAFLSGTPQGQSARYWVPDSALASYYNERLSSESPAQVGCVGILSREQVAPEGPVLRPVPEITDFVRRHPEGVTAAGETLSRHLTAESIPAHLEYEEWFEEQPRPGSRFLCPYDLRRVPPDHASDFLRELGTHHHFVCLSQSEDPAVRLLQLFLWPTARDLPEELGPDVSWASSEGFVTIAGEGGEIDLTPKGQALVHEWARTAYVDW